MTLRRSIGSVREVRRNGPNAGRECAASKRNPDQLRRIILNTERSILFATDTPSMRSLGDQLSAELVVLPALDVPESFEAWRAEVGAVPDCSRVIVSVWNATPTQGALVEQEQEAWLRRFEHPYLLWNFALGAAARRCRAGGAIVALVQTPAALDAAGWTPEMSIGDGVVALVRSLAASEGSGWRSSGHLAGWLCWRARMCRSALPAQRQGPRTRLPVSTSRQIAPAARQSR